MIARVEVAYKDGMFDGRGAEILRGAKALGLPLKAVEVIDLYFLWGIDLEEGVVDRLVGDLLCDPIIQQAKWLCLKENNPSTCSKAEGMDQVEITFLPGVTDTVAESLKGACQRRGLGGLNGAATGKIYRLLGADSDQLDRLAHQLLANTVVERIAINAPIAPPRLEVGNAPGEVAHINLSGLDDAGLLALSQERRLALDLKEMRAIQGHFEGEGRAPTDLELEMLAQTWCEHCVHKTFKAKIEYQHRDAHGVLIEDKVVDSILNTYFRAATDALDRDFVFSAFVDNAGIVDLDENWQLAFKVETHNHPSALEPFGGANTGVGGVVRDVIGVSARPIATTDILCFGPPDLPAEAIPKGVLPPNRVAEGVVAGIGDYSNKMGIPTVSGAVIYDGGYLANPLVYCGALGILPRGSHRVGARQGDRIFALGGRTGRDGLRGATFSSMEMGMETSAVASASVQIGHPIVEKQVLEVILIARDEGLYTAITDCGAGGFSSAVGEMASQLGARVQLKDVPLKYPGLAPWEIWLSEAQERMVLAVPPENQGRLREICQAHGVECCDLGHLTGDGRLSIYFGKQRVGHFDCAFLHGGIPQMELQARWQAPKIEAEDLQVVDWNRALLDLLASPNIRSKADIIRRFDHEVQGGTVVKGLVGKRNHGPSDACVLRPLDMVMASGSVDGVGVALSVGLCPQYGKIDPHAMAIAAIDEAVRNAVAVGADPDALSILDNFCWGNPRLPDRLGALIRAAEGCYAGAMAFGAPFISGKDSLNNEFTGEDGQKHAIPGTLLISAMATVPQVSRAMTLDFKSPGAWIYIVGETRAEMGGSALYQRAGRLGHRVPRQKENALAIARALYRAIRGQVISACHDLSEGGLAVGAAEMALAGGWGARLNLASLPQGACSRLDAIHRLFSESLARYLITVPPEKAPQLEALLGDLPHARLGEVRAEASFTLCHGDEILIDLSLDQLDHAFAGHIKG